MLRTIEIMSEASIKELTEEMLDQVIEQQIDDETKSEETKCDPPKPPAEENLEIKYKDASEGDRERPWVISNKMITIGELKGKRLPLLSLFESDPSAIPLQRWTIMTIEKKQYMVCKKSFFFMTNGACQLLHDVTETVVTHVMVHSEFDKGTEENKEYWKRQFAKYMKVGSMSWQEVDEQWQIDDKSNTEIKEVEDKLGAISSRIGSVTK